MSLVMEEHFRRLIDKEINFIEFTDLLERQGCRSITSHLHEDYDKLSKDILNSEEGMISYKGVVHTAGSLRKAATAESGRVRAVTVEKNMVVDTRVTVLFEDANCISFYIATFNLQRVI